MSKTSYVYISQDAAQTVSVFELNSETGHLRHVQDMAVAGKAMPMALSPDHHVLYVALRSEPYAFGNLAIDQHNGQLSLLSNSPAMESAVYTSVDQTGRFLICACNIANPARRSGLLTINPIGTDGIVQSPGIKIRTPPKLHSVVVAPDNRYLLAASCDGDQIMRFRFDTKTGTVNSDGLSPVVVFPRSGPRHMRFHPNGQFFYILNEYDASIVSYCYHAETGSLSELSTYHAAPEEFKGENKRAAELQLSSNGRFLFASVRDTSTIAAYQINAQTGQLTFTGHYATAKEPRGFALDPSGHYLVAAGALAGMINSFKINQTNGALEKIADYPIGTGPNWVEIISL